jgi:hypothetical protein
MKEKNKNSTSIYMNQAESRLDSSSINLRLQKFAHITEMIKIKLMTWFIELQNRFNESRLFKISIIYVLNQINDLTSW